MEDASNAGSKKDATEVIAGTKPSTFKPITLIGNCDGYVIKDWDWAVSESGGDARMIQLSQRCKLAKTQAQQFVIDAEKRSKFVRIISRFVRLCAKVSQKFEALEYGTCNA
jgi:hypothetical protein